MQQIEQAKQIVEQFPIMPGTVPPHRHEECRAHGTVFHAVYEECPVCRAEDIRKRDAARVSIQARLYGGEERNLPVIRPSAGEVFGEDANADYRETAPPPGLGWWILLGIVGWLVLMACGAVIWLWSNNH